MRVLRIVVTCSLLAIATRGEPRPGMLDPTFGFEGHAGEISGVVGSLATRVALLSDGRTLVAATPFVGGPSGDLLLAFQANGQPDPSFGTGGIVSLADHVVSVVPDSGGAFYTLEGGENADAEIARYDAAGVPDATFGVGGRVTVSFGGLGPFDSQYVNVLVRLANGRFVVAGSHGTSSSQDVVVVRCLADGSPDASFGTGGTARFTFAAGFLTIGAVLEQSDGKLVVAGGYNSVLGDNELLLRLEVGGSLDAGFGSGGMVTGSGRRFWAGTLQTDGKIVVAGSARIARYDTSGALDSGFGSSGVVITEIQMGEGADANNIRFGAVLVDPDGKIVVAGRRTVPLTGPPLGTPFILERYLSDGTPDAGFGRAGRVSGGVWGEGATVSSIVRRGDGRLILGMFELFAVLRAYLGGTCGNGTPEDGEECDDGNTIDGDGCDADCCLVDVDDDGVCDAIDPCVGGVPMTKSLLRTSKWLTNARTLLIKADMQFAPAQAAALDPAADGVRLVIDDAVGNRHDVAIPPAVQFEPSDIHWKSNSAGPSWSGRLKYGHAPFGAPAGLYLVSIRSNVATGLVKLKAKGRGGPYFEDSQSPPHALRIVLGSPLHGTAVCSEVRYSGPAPAPSCALSTSRLVCK